LTTSGQMCAGRMFTAVPTCACLAVAHTSSSHYLRSPLAGAPGGSEGSQMDTYGALGNDDDYLALGNAQDSPQ